MRKIIIIVGVVVVVAVGGYVLINNRSSGNGAATAGTAGISLDGRYARLRYLAAAHRERPMTPMTPGVIADSIVNLCGAIGLGVAMVTLYRRDPRSPLTRRLLVALGIIALLFLVRGVAWWSGSGVLDNLSMIPAALIPLGALIVTEGILRRHAPRPAKIVILTGGIVLGLAGAVGSERFAAPFAILLVLFQLGGFAICAWLLVRLGTV